MHTYPCIWCHWTDCMVAFQVGFVSWGLFTTLYIHHVARINADSRTTHTGQIQLLRRERNKMARRMHVVTIVLLSLTFPHPLTTLPGQNPVNPLTFSADEFLPIYNAAVPWANLVSRRRNNFFGLPIVHFPCPTLPQFDVPKERAPVFILSQHLRVSDHDQQGLRSCDGHLQSTCQPPVDI